MCHHLMKYKAASEEVPEVGRRKWSCLIFATRKVVVLGIQRFLHLSKRMNFLRSKTLMGYGSRVGGQAIDFKEQQSSLKKFKEGELNTLVATSVAEEGLDLTACRLVLRFNPPNTTREFIQSRGRARDRNAHMVVMIEEGCEAESSLLEEVRQNEMWMRDEATRRTIHIDDEEAETEEDERWVNAAMVGTA
eukprot:jgi/Botrbrau1/14205/Bobra.0291s0010.1